MYLFEVFIQYLEIQSTKKKNKVLAYVTMTYSINCNIIEYAFVTDFISACAKACPGALNRTLD